MIDQYLDIDNLNKQSISDPITWEDHTTVTPLEKFQAKLENIFKEWYIQCSNTDVKSVIKLESIIEYEHYKFLVLYSPPITFKTQPFPYYHNDPSVFILKKSIQSPLDFLPIHCDFILLGPYSTMSQSIEHCKIVQSCAYMALHSIQWNIPIFVISRSELPHFHGIASVAPSPSLLPNYIWYIAHFTEQERYLYMIPKRIQEPDFWSNIHSYISQRIYHNILPVHEDCVIMMGYSISIKPWSIQDINNSISIDSISSFSLGNNINVPFGHTRYPMDNIDRIHLDAMFYSNIPYNRSPRFLDGDKFTISIQKKSFSSFQHAALCNIVTIWKLLYEDCIINKYRSVEGAPYAYPALFKKAKLKEYLSDASVFFKHKHIFYHNNESPYYYTLDRHFDILDSLFMTIASQKSSQYDSFTNESNIDGFVIPKSNIMSILSRYMIITLLSMTQSKPDSECAMDYLPIMADIWRAFCLVLRYHWETLTPFPLPFDITERLFYRSTLSVQKIFLLNHCIEVERLAPTTQIKEDISSLLDNLNVDNDRIVQKLANNLSSIKKHFVSKILPKDNTLKQFALKTDDDIKSMIEKEQDMIDEEPFFDAMPTSQDNTKHSLKQLENEYLLFHPSEPLYIPIVQQLPKFQSQDLIDAKMNALEKVNDAETRIRIQCEQLYSDIQAFKAANPKSSFEDFIRWYSPRDWDKVEKKLSTRMGKSDDSNIWLQLWNSAPACPISKQPLLLDHRQEAERILYYFDDMSVLEFCIQNIPSMIFCISEILFDDNPATHALVNMLKIFPWKELESQDGLVMDDLIGRIYDLEEYLGIKKALISKFPDNQDLVQNILESLKSIVVKDSSEYQAMKNLILESDQRSMLDTATSERIVARQESNDIQDITFIVNQDSHGRTSSNLIYMLHRNNKLD